MHLSQLHRARYHSTEEIMLASSQLQVSEKAVIYFKLTGVSANCCPAHCLGG